MEILETIPKYEEVWDLPSNDQRGWEKIVFINENGKPYKLLNRDFKYRRVAGHNYIHYGFPIEVRNDLPLTSITDSFTTLLRAHGIYQYNNDYIILKDKNYKSTAK